MIKVHEISEEEFAEIESDSRSLADKLNEYYTSLGWKNISSEHFLSGQYTPCIFSQYIDPKTGEDRKGIKIPKTFKSQEKIGKTYEVYIEHFSPAGCPELKTGLHIVKCLCRKDLYDRKGAFIGEKFYYGEHCVGQCPWKTRDKNLLKT